MRNVISVCWLLCLMISGLKAQDISRIEYYFNTDPGFGQGTPITGFTPAPDVANFPASINLSAVSNGMNMLYLRALDNNGHWSITNAIPFIKVDVDTYNVVRAEYFIDSDPGFGQGTAITGFTPSPDVAGFPVSINLGAVGYGLHNLYVRCEDANGHWSITNEISFIKTDVTTYNIEGAEYFLNTDPGFGNGTPFTLPVSPNITQQTVTIDITSAPLGINSLFIRTTDGSGNRSLTNTLTFIKGTVEGDISGLEYFIDTDPGFGLATPVALVPAQDINNYIFNADVSGLTNGTTHSLFIRSKDADGSWSLTNILSFTKMSGIGIPEVTDASAAFSATPNPAFDKITLSCAPDVKMDKIELIDVQGKLVQVPVYGTGNEKVIDLSRLRNGIYFIRITSDGDVVFKKIVKD